MPDNRETLQVNQPNVINNPETNWPHPLSDPSNKLKLAVTSGGNGRQNNFDPVSTSQQDAGQHHLAEGKHKASPGNREDQGGHTDKLKTSQQNAGDHSTAEGA